jgi:dUTPase/Chromo (CHRromatin Organisation MOdifier) domain
LIKWKDFPTEDNSWEPASVIHEDVRLMVKEFHSTHPNAIRTILTSTLPVKRLDDTAHLPTRTSTVAAGQDLHSAVSVRIPACGHALVNTKLAIAVPAGFYGRIAPRSGLALKHGINVAQVLLIQIIEDPLV